MFACVFAFFTQSLQSSPVAWWSGGQEAAQPVMQTLLSIGNSSRVHSKQFGIIIISRLWATPNKLRTGDSWAPTLNRQPLPNRSVKINQWTILFLLHYSKANIDQSGGRFWSESEKRFGRLCVLVWSCLKAWTWLAARCIFGEQKAVFSSSGIPLSSN